MLVDVGIDVNAEGGFYGNALQATSAGGHEEVVQMLLDAGANVNAEGGEDGNALQAASLGGHEKVVQMLLEAGAGCAYSSIGGEQRIVLWQGCLIVNNALLVILNLGARWSRRTGRCWTPES